ncbi:hypothetical protein L580_2830 [Serratia fonticola AU-P3(3)]|nr:hypothetical protein L580_2830 [Serratia fonticola AU-P3(3)]
MIPVSILFAMINHSPAKPCAERHDEIEAMFKDIKLPTK